MIKLRELGKIKKNNQEYRQMNFKSWKELREEKLDREFDELHRERIMKELSEKETSPIFCDLPDTIHDAFTMYDFLSRLLCKHWQYITMMCEDEEFNKFKIKGKTNASIFEMAADYDNIKSFAEDVKQMWRRVPVQDKNAEDWRWFNKKHK